MEAEDTSMVVVGTTIRAMAMATATGMAMDTTLLTVTVLSGTPSSVPVWSLKYVNR